MRQEDLRILLEDGGDRHHRHVVGDRIERQQRVRAHEEIELAGDQQHAVVVVGAARHDGDVEAVFLVGAVGDAPGKIRRARPRRPSWFRTRPCPARSGRRAGATAVSRARRPAVNARGKKAGFMVGLRRSFWPMMGGSWTRIASLRGSAPRQTTSQIASNETLRSMTSTLPPRDWTDIHWPDISGGRCGALDRGVAAGGDRAAWPASAARHRRHDRRGLSGAGARAVARKTFPRRSCRCSRSAFPPSTSIIRAR